MSAKIITSVVVDEGPSHDRVRVWNRGGLAGVLVVTHGDGEVIARRMLCLPCPHCEHPDHIGHAENCPMREEEEP
jgi:hypothetical protein